MALLRVVSGCWLEVRRAETVGRGSCSRNCGAESGSIEKKKEVGREQNERLLGPGRCSAEESRLACISQQT